MDMVKKAAEQKSSASNKETENSNASKSKPNSASKAKVAAKADTTAKTKSSAKMDSEPQNPTNSETEALNDKKPVKQVAETKQRAKDARRLRREQIKARRFRHPMPGVLRVLLSMLVLVVFARIFTWYILLQQNMGDAEATDTFFADKPVLAMYSYVIVLLTMCVIAAITWRPFFTTGLSFAAAAVIMYINTQKFQYRDAPLLPEDFLLVDQAGTIASFVDPWSVTRLALGVVLILIGTGLLERCARRVMGVAPKGRFWWERHSILPRIMWTSVSLAGLLMFAHPVLHYEDEGGEESAKWIDGLGFSHWHQKNDYQQNGFIIAFLYNLGGIHEAEPDNYSQKTIAEVVDKYQDKEKTKYTSLTQAADNIIVVLNESFIDPEILGEIYRHEGGDVVPNLHEIFKKYPSGYMYSPGYGGGTADIEFEVLTSLSNYWAQATPYVTSVSKMSHVPGITKNATDDGMIGTAIHAYDGTMYKRNAVYNRMGFKTFLDDSSMQHTEHENGGGYISDRAIYDEALEVLNDGEKQHMVMLVTMQNHTGYNTAGYTEFNFSALEQINDAYMYTAYLETIHHADEYLGEFVKALDQLEERTVMVWFGDHGPSVLSDYTDSGDPALVDMAHLTPYFIYANFELDEPYTEAEVAKLNAKAGFKFDTDGVNLPVVTPNCLMSEMYQALDVKMPPLVYLSSKVCEETPILAPVYSKNDEIKETETLRDYRMVNYDILSGKRYWLDS